MTWPRMWKCNVYTFNHVLSHRPLPPSSNSQLRMSILSPRLSFPPPPLRYNDINVRPGCVLYPYPPSWHGPQTWRVLRFRGGRGRGTTVLLLEEWNPLKWMRGGFWRWRCRWMLESRPRQPILRCLRATNMQIQNRLREHFHIRNDAVTREIQRDVSWIISFLERTVNVPSELARLLRGIRTVSRYSYCRL